MFPPRFFCSWVTAWVKTRSRWAGTGRILVEEFNDNCDKIDAALKALEDAQTVVKLLDMTTTEVLSEVTLDLSGIDLTRYHKLDIWLMPNLSGTGGRTARLYSLWGQPCSDAVFRHALPRCFTQDLRPTAPNLRLTKRPNCCDRYVLLSAATLWQR